MKPKPTDEMFDAEVDEAGGSVSLLVDISANEKEVHYDFFNDFGDLFDDDDLS